MEILKTVKEVQKFVQTQKELGKTVGFVPTMGALHEGHLSLIRQSRAACTITVCSIFVNPTQFDDPADLEKYPRPVERDINMLESEDCDALFLPSVEEVYPESLDAGETYDFGFIDKPMEGAHRTGHFDGVAQVVNRLLEIVQPTHLFMGQKDYQQFKIIDRLIELTKRPTQLVMCAIVREEDGLAMSSRNVRLNPDARAKAVTISQTLRQVKAGFGHKSIVELKKWGFEQLERVDGMSVDYFEIVDADTLKNIDEATESQQVIACAAVRVGGIRLIDNILLKVN